MQIRERFFEHLLKSEKEIPPLLRGQELLTSQGNVRHCLGGCHIIGCLIRGLLVYYYVFFKSPDMT